MNRLALLIVFLLPILAFAGEDTDEKANALVRKKLIEIVLPQVEMTNVPLPKALEQLSELSQKAAPDKQGVTIVFDAKAKQQGLPRPPDNRNVTVKLRKIPLLEALKFIEGQTNTDHRIEGGQVIVFPAKT